MHLAVGDQRIDDAAGILHGEEFLDPHAAGFHVNLNHGDVAGVGEGPGRIVMRRLAQSRHHGLKAVCLVVSRARQRRYRHHAIGA